jgi:hypothetical protein
VEVSGADGASADANVNLAGGVNTDATCTVGTEGILILNWLRCDSQSFTRNSTILVSQSGDAVRMPCKMFSASLYFEYDFV